MSNDIGTYVLKSIFIALDPEKKIISLCTIIFTFKIRDFPLRVGSAGGR